MTEIEMFRGAMIGGACGDALGYPCRSFLSVVFNTSTGPLACVRLCGMGSAEIWRR